MMCGSCCCERGCSVGGCWDRTNEPLSTLPHPLSPLKSISSPSSPFGLLSSFWSIRVFVGTDHQCFVCEIIIIIISYKRCSLLLPLFTTPSVVGYPVNYSYVGDHCWINVCCMSAIIATSLFIIFCILFCCPLVFSSL